MDKTLRRLVAPGRLAYPLLLLLALAALYTGQYILALIASASGLVLLGVSLIVARRREKKLGAYIQRLVYETESAKSHTLLSFPLPIAIFKLEDTRIVWGNEMFFKMCGEEGTRLDASLSDLVPQFSAGWLNEGETVYPSLIEVQGRRFCLHGSLIRDDGDENAPFMGITYWVDVTEYDNIRIEYERSRPAVGIIVIDNLDDLMKNLPDRVKNDLRDAVEDKLNQWRARFNGILRRYDRDRYILLMEQRDLEMLKAEKFRITDDIHSVQSPTGINATISIGLGVDAANFSEGLQIAENAAELALSRGGDQTVVKGHSGFEFYGGRGSEVEKRTRVKSRVVANSFSELLRESSYILIMGHRFGDMDSFGAAAGVYSIARQLGIRANIVADIQHSAAAALAERLMQDPAYHDVFMSPSELPARVDRDTLLVVVDTSRPEQVEVPALLSMCQRIAVVDHHRVAATYIKDAALAFIEPYASSACELVTEILQELPELKGILHCEAEALLAGIVLDTKSFTLRTGERTFDAASWLRAAGADTGTVKRLFQADLPHTLARYKLLQQAEIYRGVAIAAPTKPQDRVVAAQAADEMLNISGVEASVVVAPDGSGGSFASARSIGELSVQILMEKLGGGGNRAAAAAQFPDLPLDEALRKIYAAIDEYMSQS